MYGIGQNPEGSALSGIDASSYQSTVSSILNDPTRSKLNFLGINLGGSPSQIKTDANNASKGFDFQRWGTIALGIVIFIGGIIMLTHQTSVVLTKG